MFALPELPYALDALWPHISPETMKFHYGKHHKTYVENLNKLIKENPAYEKMSLEEVVISSKEKGDVEIFNNSAQNWNHSFFWKSLSPKGPRSPKENLLNLIKEKWGDFDAFKDEFSEKALKNFGSGWTWLVVNESKKLDIYNTSNADNPLSSKHQALFNLDVWEHAYYIDYKNARVDFIKAFWNIVNWNYASENLEVALGRK